MACFPSLPPLTAILRFRSLLHITPPPYSYPSLFHLPSISDSFLFCLSSFRVFIPFLFLLLRVAEGARQRASAIVELRTTTEPLAGVRPPSGITGLSCVTLSHSTSLPDFLVHFSHPQTLSLLPLPLPLIPPFLCFPPRCCPNHFYSSIFPFYMRTLPLFILLIPSSPNCVFSFSKLF